MTIAKSTGIGLFLAIVVALSAASSDTAPLWFKCAKSAPALPCPNIIYPECVQGICEFPDDQKIWWCKPIRSWIPRFCDFSPPVCSGDCLGEFDDHCWGTPPLSCN